MAVEMIVRPIAVTVVVFSFFLSFLARFGLIVWYVEYIRIRVCICGHYKSLTSPRMKFSQDTKPPPFEGKNIPPISTYEEMRSR